MTKKNLYFMMFILLSFMFFPFNINAQETVIENTNTINTLDKWVTDSKTKDVYYYENGAKVKGFKEIEGKVYYFGQTSGKMLTGWQELNGNKFYLFPEIREGIQTIEKNKYYIKDKYIQKGFQTAEDGKTYYFGQTSGKMLTGWQELDGNKFYLFPEIREEIQTIEGNKYYTKDKYIQKGFRTVDNKTYYFGQTSGKMLTGWQELDGNKFYLFPEIREGIQTIDKNKYYIKNNVIQKGFQTAEDGKTYYFGQTSGKMLTGWQELNGKKFYLFPEIREGIQTIEKSKYYIKDKYIQYGFQTAEDGYTYYFGQNSGKMLTGWQKLNGNSFYLDENGRTLADGLYDIDNDGKTYYFINKFAQTGITKIGEDYYYFDPKNNGKMVKAKFVTQNGNTYFVGRTTGKVQRGWMDWEDQTYYANLETGALLSGLQLLKNREDPNQNNYYLFGSKTYKLMKNWQRLGENIYYANPIDGVLVSGYQTIENRNYKFSDNCILEGFYTTNGKTYYKNPDGTLAKGVQRLAGLYYKFDDITGAFQNYVNQRQVIDVSHHQGIINWEAVKNSGKVDAVIVRLGYIGTISEVMDTQFLRNISELNRLSIPYSVYLYSYAYNPSEASEEADFLIRTINNPLNHVHIDSSKFSIYYDIEEYDGIDYGGIMTTFIDKVESALHIKTRVYANLNFINKKFPADKRHYATWVAHWANSIGYDGPYEAWQFTDCANVPGIDGCVDMSYFYY